MRHALLKWWHTPSSRQVSPDLFHSTFLLWLETRIAAQTEQQQLCAHQAVAVQDRVTRYAADEQPEKRYCSDCIESNREWNDNWEFYVLLSIRSRWSLHSRLFDLIFWRVPFIKFHIYFSLQPIKIGNRVGSHCVADWWMIMVIEKQYDVEWLEKVNYFEK